MTDDIAGLSERLREDIAQLVTAISQAKFSGPRTGVRVKDPSALMDDLTDAATQLDALLKERDALQARVKELEKAWDVYDTHTRLWKIEHDRKLEEAESRALRAEQERDELKADRERLWCTACGTVTRDQICDCNRWPHMAEAGHKPNFVNYTDAMATDARLAMLDVARLQQERDEAIAALKPFVDVAEEMLSRGWDASNVALALDNPNEPHRVTAGDFFAIRRLAGPEKEGK